MDSSFTTKTVFNRSKLNVGSCVKFKGCYWLVIKFTDDVISLIRTSEIFEHNLSVEEFTVKEVLGREKEWGWEVMRCEDE